MNIIFIRSYKLSDLVSSPKKITFQKNISHNFEEQIFEFLSPNEVEGFQKTNKENRNLVHQSELGKRKLLEAKLQKITPRVLESDFHKTWFSFFTNPTFLDLSEEEVKSVFDRVLDRYLFPKVVKEEEQILVYDKLAKLLKSDPISNSQRSFYLQKIQPILARIFPRFFPKKQQEIKPSPAAIGKFCHYLVDRLKEEKVWVVFRILQNFLPLGKNEVEKEIKLYLKNQVEKHLIARPQYYNLDNGSIIRFIQIKDVDPKVWFGKRGNSFSLWNDAPHLPHFMQEAIYNHIFSLQRQNPNVPITLKMFSRFDAPLPKDFTFPLVEQLTNNLVFVGVEETISIQRLRNPFYARDLSYLEEEEIENLPQGTIHLPEPSRECIVM